MQFYTWMKRNYMNDLTAKGTLARSMVTDVWWPKQLDRRVRILKQLKCRNSSEKCIAAFEECWEEYEKCEKNRLSQN